MNKNAPEIAQLRIDIESDINHKVRTPYDFDSLSGAIWERMHENLSPTTLKRLWGYISGADNPNWTTCFPFSVLYVLIFPVKTQNIVMAPACVAGYTRFHCCFSWSFGYLVYASHGKLSITVSCLYQRIKSDP